MSEDKNENGEAFKFETEEFEKGRVRRKPISTETNPPLHELNAATQKAKAEARKRNERLQNAIKKEQQKIVKEKATPTKPAKEDK